MPNREQTQRLQMVREPQPGRVQGGLAEGTRKMPRLPVTHRKAGRTPAPSAQCSLQRVFQWNTDEACWDGLQTLRGKSGSSHEVLERARDTQQGIHATGSILGNVSFIPHPKTEE